MKTQNLFFTSFIILVIFFSGCSGKKTISLSNRSYVSKTVLKNIRLGDGVPLDIYLSIRWGIKDQEKFYDQYFNITEFDSLILQPRQNEIASLVSNNYLSVDSVFTCHRERYLNDIKSSLKNKLGEGEVDIREVIISRLIFPRSFTTAMEQVGYKEREIEAIRQISIIDLEKAIAEEEKATADGKVKIAKALMEGKVEQINAETEKHRRLNRLAKAETESRINEMNAKDDAKRLRVLAKAEAEKKRLFSQVMVLERKDLKDIEIQKQKELDKLKFDKELDMAKLCSENPAYATFLVNKEIASKIQIAVLPSGTGGGMIDNLLQNSFYKK